MKVWKGDVMAGFLIDLDGTMYKGIVPIDGAIEWIDRLNAYHVDYLFLTNNSSRTPKQAAAHMNKMGFNVTADKFYTSAMAAVATIKLNDPDAKSAAYIGEDGMYEALVEAGFKLDYHNPQYFFVGLNRQATYQEYSEAARLIVNGAKLVGTNNDRILLSEKGVNVGNGSIVAMLEYCCSRSAIKIGKPYSPIFEGALEKLSLPKDDVYVVGDNLETDIMGATKCGLKSIFIDSGVHQLADVGDLGIQPTYYVKNVLDIESLFQ